MNIGSVVRFNDERFFDGAVQLGWLDKRHEQALCAAESFVFHGPRYHGANEASLDGVDNHYKLKDTASFVQDLLGSMLHGEQGHESNPYWLVVAGYGSGKSHLALTCSTLLSTPHSETAGKILNQLSHADKQIGSNIEKQLSALDKPALVLPLDGMSGFHLGNALSQAVFKQLALLNIDAEPLRSLSPRFNVACKFVERNYHVRQDRFRHMLPQFNEEEICHLLKENDETVYEAIDAIYTEANGQSIPIEGQESAQELIETLCHFYCGEDGHFSQIIIMFDEFGRYLEYAADKPHLAGDAALQQIFQGIQDNSDKIRFVGFIQYELKTYLKRFGGAGLRQLQRYITRFDAAEKWYLSTNLETIFAHMIHKDECALDEALLKANAKQGFDQTHRYMSMCIPSLSRFPVWQDSERFAQVIGRGCWPLHPMAVWFLTRQKDVVQSRSALTFIKDTIARVSQNSIIENGVISQVSAAELVVSSMLSELVAAEREVGGTVAETLQTLLEKFSSHLERTQQLILAGVAALEKMRIGKQTQEIANIMLQEATALNEVQVKQSLVTLSELGALEWNKDLGQYELLTDGASRGQFQQWLRKQQLSLGNNDARNLFLRRAASEDILVDIETDFGLANNISTRDWFFEATFAHSGNLSNCLKQAFREWSEAILPTDAKGKVIYLYIDSKEDRLLIEQEIQTVFNQQLAFYEVRNAPIWLIGLDDSDSLLIDNLSKLYLFEEILNDADKERFRRFIPDEIQRSQSGVKTALTQFIKQHDFWIAGIEQVPQERLKKIGNIIFSTIYTKPLPFEFDGFANKNGGGNADSAALMKGLLTKQIDGSWIQSQPVRLRNRINTLMAQCWGAVTVEGKLIVPRETKIHNIFSELLFKHQDEPTRTFNDSYQELLRPPYGMNTASAGLLLSMLVGLDIPPRRLEYKKELIASKEWLAFVFPKKDQQLNRLVLKSTCFRFLSETSESRWRELLERWTFVNTYNEQLTLVCEMKKLNKVDPIPENLEGTYLHWLSEGKIVEEKVASKQSELNRIEKELERQTRNVAVGHALSIAKKLHQLDGDFESSGLWPQSLVNECRDLLKVSHSIFVDELSDWISRQTCRSVANLVDFRNEMKVHTRNLELLGYKREAEALSKQTTSSIHRVEKIQEFQLTISQCADYPRQPVPTASTSVREIRDEVIRGDKLIKILNEALGTFTEQEVNAHISAISNRQEILKKADLDKRNELSVLYNSPQSEQELAEVIQRAQYLQRVFIGTRDEQDISEIVYQLEYMLNDIRAWPVEDISATRLEELLNSQSSEQANAFLVHLEEKEMEATWCDDIYQIIAAERIKKAYLRSKEWTKVRYLELDSVVDFDLQRCLMLKQEIENAPRFLSHQDKEKVYELLLKVNSQIACLYDKQCRIENKDWLDSFSVIDDMSTLDNHSLNNYLSLISRPPNTLSDSESMIAHRIEQKLHAQQDLNSMDNIMERIYKLPLLMQIDILNLLSSSINKEEV